MKSKQFYIVYDCDLYSLPVRIYDNCSDLANFFGKTKNAMFLSIRNCKNNLQQTIQRNTDKKHFIVKRWCININGEVMEY